MNSDNDLAPFTRKDFCPTLEKCLLYQACVFDFSLDFCGGQDFAENLRKVVEVVLICKTDETLQKSLGSQDAGKNNQVLHIKPKKKSGKVDFELLSRPEVNVFTGSCPADPYAAGFRGICNSPGKNQTSQSLSLWPLLARTSDEKCRKDLTQIFCAFEFDNNARCVPPFTIMGNQSDKVMLEDLKFNEISFPKVGDRPKTEKNLRHNSLKAAKIAFIIAAHKDPPSLIQLLENIHHPEHIYLIHIDKRASAMRNFIAGTVNNNPKYKENVRVLPTDRSVSPIWGSYGMVRAMLELMEEAVRMSDWDFVIMLSGSDLPLRSVDDLAMSLAAYKGKNFFQFYTSTPRNGDPKLKWTNPPFCFNRRWGCDGFYFRVTYKETMPTLDELEIYTVSSFVVVNREYVEDIVDQNRHPDAFKRHIFYLQMSSLPDESFFSTFAMNSRHKGSVNNVGIHFLKGFEEVDSLGLCRHMEESDTCGRGPGNFAKSDGGQFWLTANRFFFARKFLTNDTGDFARTEALRVKNNYYKLYEEYFSEAILKLLAMEALKRVPKHYSNWLESEIIVENYQILTKFHAADRCCQVFHDTHLSSVGDHSILLDFRNRKSRYRAKFDIKSQAKCFGKGHLRLFWATTWTGPKNLPSDYNIPLPFFTSGKDFLRSIICLQLERLFCTPPAKLSA